MMFTGVPNLVWIFGYFRASWTLRVDLIGDFVCRLLHHMDELGVKKVTPRLRAQDTDTEVLPWLDPEDFNPGYLMRSMDLLPKRLDRPEWQHTQDYWTETRDAAQRRPRRRLPAIRMTTASEATSDPAACESVRPRGLSHLRPPA